MFHKIAVDDVTHLDRKRSSYIAPPDCLSDPSKVSALHRLQKLDRLDENLTKSATLWKVTASKQVKIKGGAEFLQIRAEYLRHEIDLWRHLAVGAPLEL